MNCCAIETSIRQSASAGDESVGGESSKSVTQGCTNCGGLSRPVSRKMVLLMVKPELLEQAMSGTYGFCSAGDCPVVYFEDQSSNRFTIDDLRIRLGLKVKEDPIPLCYCFGFDVSHIRDEISRTGNTNIPERISALIRQGLCACETRNPSGMCCLGEVNKTANRLRETLQS
jgi:hypothetical protein